MNNSGRSQGRKADDASEEQQVRLGELAHTRSGDKGDRSNIGVVANDAALYAWLQDSPDRTRPSENSSGRWASARSSAMSCPDLHAFNFVDRHALAGGASRSLRIDTQGKALGTVLLELLIPAPRRVGRSIPKRVLIR